MTTTPRLTVTLVSRLAWAKGWEFCQHTRRGARYLARPAHHAIFAREQATTVFTSLRDARNWLTHSAPEPIASRLDYDWLRAMRAFRARHATPAAA